MAGTAVIFGAGIGLSASLARKCAAEGLTVALAARNLDKLENLSKDIGATLHQCDVAIVEQVRSTFDTLDKSTGTLEIVIYNPSARLKGQIERLDPNAVKEAIDITCYGAFLVAQQAAMRMLKKGSGSIFFTGASAGIKGFANSSVFAMGKFGMRGLAQALARELHPKNIHIGHFIIDGGIRADHRAERLGDGSDNMLDPDAIANTYLQIHQQHRSAWAWEIELRPWVEKF